MSEAKPSRDAVLPAPMADDADVEDVTWAPEPEPEEATAAAWGGQAGAEDVTSEEPQPATDSPSSGPLPQTPSPPLPVVSPPAAETPSPVAKVSAGREVVEDAFQRLPGDTATSVLQRVNVEVAAKRRMEWTAQRRIIVVLVVAGCALLLGGYTAILTPGCWLAAAILTWVWKMRSSVRWSVTFICAMGYFAVFVLVGAMYRP